MDTLKLKKIVKLSFLGLCAIYIGTMMILCNVANNNIKAFGEIMTNTEELQFSVLNNMQKPLITTNIIFFAVLLAIALWLYYQTTKKSFTYIPVVIFSLFALFCYVSLSGIFFNLGGNNANLSGQYWLMFFIGLFFIAGALSVTVIGTIAVKNILKHKRNINQPSTTEK